MLQAYFNIRMQMRDQFVTMRFISDLYWIIFGLLLFINEDSDGTVLGVIKHDIVTRKTLLDLVCILFMLITVVTRVFWSILRQPMPWYAFRQLGLLVSLLVHPAIISSPTFCWVTHRLFGQCLHKSVIVIWRFLTTKEKFFVLGLPALFNVYLWLRDAEEYNRETMCKTIISCTFSAPQKKIFKRLKTLEEAQQARDLQAREDAATQELCRREQEASVKKQEDRWADTKERLQCSICLGFLRQPYVTSCGHVFDLACLLRWFIDAPPFEDLDLDLDPTHPHYFWARSKTCPFCRAVLKSPPTPLFFLEGLLDVVGDDDDDAAGDPPARVCVRPLFWFDMFERETLLLPGRVDEEEEEAERIVGAVLPIPRGLGPQQREVRRPLLLPREQPQAEQQHLGGPQALLEHDQADMIAEDLLPLVPRRLEPQHQLRHLILFPREALEPEEAPDMLAEDLDLHHRAPRRRLEPPQPRRPLLLLNLPREQLQAEPQLQPEPALRQEILEPLNPRRHVDAEIQIQVIQVPQLLQL